MLKAKEVGDALKARGYDFYSGVPCSSLKNLINYAVNDCTYVMAANEGDAVATCAGASLGGRKAVVLMQNSGLTNATSPLVSLNFPFRLPVLGFVSLRGEPGKADEPQHELIGEITGSLLTLMKIKWEFLSDRSEKISEQITRADEAIAGGQSWFFVVRKGTFETEKLRGGLPKPKGKAHAKEAAKIQRDGLPRREEVLAKIASLVDDDTVLLTTTGYTGRELFEVKDAPRNLYMVGSMGCVSAIGLGLALARPDKKIIAIDGDGALLMRLGSLATNGYYGPKNLLHILLDNKAHETTGGQFTVSPSVDFVALAAATGYAGAFHVPDVQGLGTALEKWLRSPELSFFYLRIPQGSRSQLGRPTVKPYEVKERLMKYLGSGHIS